MHCIVHCTALRCALRSVALYTAQRCGAIVPVPLYLCCCTCAVYLCLGAIVPVPCIVPRAIVLSLTPVRLQEKLFKAVYHKDFSAAVDSSNTRRTASIQRLLAVSLSTKSEIAKETLRNSTSYMHFPDKHSDQKHFNHLFRDRQKHRELSPKTGPLNGHFSARTYVPRAVYKGGGQLNRSESGNLVSEQVSGQGRVLHARTGERRVRVGRTRVKHECGAPRA